MHCRVALWWCRRLQVRLLPIVVSIGDRALKVELRIEKRRVPHRGLDHDIREHVGSGAMIARRDGLVLLDPK